MKSNTVSSNKTTSLKESVDIRPVKKGEYDAPDEPTYDSIKARVWVEVQSWEARVQGLGP